MERDFLGLSVKQETSDAVPLRSSTTHWSFPNKAASIPPQLLSFQEEKGKVSFGSLAITTDAFDSSDRKAAYVSPKKSVVLSERNGGATVYSAKHNESSHMNMIHHTVGNPLNLSIAAPGSGSVHRRPFDLSLGSTSQCLVANVAFANPVTGLPSGSSPVVGSTDLRHGSKISGGSTQLTIFYNGSVSVYDNITPDKAEAIMLLAGNSPPSPMPAPRPPPVLDPFLVSTTPHPHRSSPIAVAQPYVLSCTNSETIAAKTTGVFMSSSVIAEPLRLNKSLASASMKFHSSDTVPQFRKKSLARFLEKRKERVINALPYDKEPKDCSNSKMGHGSNASGSCPVPAMN